MKRYLLGLALAMSSASLFAQVGVGTDTPKATLDIVAKNTSGTSTDVDGVLIPRVDRARAQSMTQVAPSTLIYVNNSTTGEQINQTKNVDSEGFYYFVLDTANSTTEVKGYWVKLGAEYAKPEFFYMPSVLLPTLATDTKISADGTSGYSYSNGVYTVNLYSLFNKQFGTPVKSSSESSNLTGFVLDANQYDYFITYIDETVFDKESIILLPDGKVSYKVKPDAIIRNGSFMNVVLKVK
ncbi:hypothetical protein [Faecalibacter bovis]|uniref:Uncharacterized protein n=1 Tax=Faecalibacter bovis TaxID=2898187 RepID=A0ABX7XEK3_9FLAO|nr:hypothetical protein [Faecalibacter bovis]QTV06358.1 hypothetical protein J9309_03235 [Faecalibacter bovis]